ncbi:MAG: hypothetical protein A3D94_11465 [Alphaproteobacteria bacterium RIFCSPHIGHO2_12_FULL_66_14]|jgi:hypothetical protein|nr:MAG: hypothetical protein A3D94_11465 [Alphaproteobacteria bacterium RIFCSPHIGHO2_12_FULL_66_14]
MVGNCRQSLFRSVVEAACFAAVVSSVRRTCQDGTNFERDEFPARDAGMEETFSWFGRGREAAQGSIANGLWWD